MKKVWPILMLLGSLLAACAPQQASLTGSWTLTAYGPQSSTIPAVADSQAGLTFNEDGSVTGNSGCNGLGGTYEVDGDQITFSPFVSTLMACDDPIMSQEGAMHQVLNGTVSYAIDGDVLTLTNDSMVLVFTSASNPYP
ncbi:MAG TPA: META domain-containing protein [Anaerolineales bacterium]|nr:META domain-containing protein [Anaerolineales bacterium]